MDLALKELQACRKGQRDVHSMGGCGEAEVQILALMGVPAAQAGGSQGCQGVGSGTPVHTPLARDETGPLLGLDG